MRRRRRVYEAADPLAPDVRVREAINARPAIQGRLRALGIGMFDDVPFVAPSMTFGALALATGWRPWDLVSALESPLPGDAPQQ